MSKQKVEMIEKAEKAVIARASKIAYERSNNLDDSEVQAMLYRLCKDYIILGARMMEEELMKLGYYETEKNLIERAKANGSIQRLNMLISAAHILNCEANSLIEEAADLMAENGLMLGSLKRLHNNFVKAADLYFKDFASMVSDDGSKMDMFEDMDGFKKLFRKWSRLDQEGEPNN